MSEVTAKDFRDALFAAFDTFWADRTQIAPPNVGFDPAKIPADETAYVRLYLLGDEDGQKRYSNSVSRNHFSRSGTFTAQVYVREKADLDQAYALAEAVVEFLEKPDVSDALFSNISSPQELGPEGAWFLVQVSSTWVYWTDRAA